MVRRNLDGVLFLVLLLVIGLRPLIGETLTSALDPVSASLAELSDPTLVRTMTFDLILLVISAIVLLRLAIRGSVRASGLGWGTALLAVAAVVSSLVAGDKRPAITSAMDLIAALLATAALVQLLDRPWRVVLTVCVVIASGMANVGECADERISAKQMQEQYASQRDALWTARGVPLDAPQVRLFEQRMLSAESTGFFAHSNVAGGYLLCGLMVAAGLVVAAWRIRESGEVLAALLVIAFGVGVWLTRGTGAAVAGALGIAVIVLRTWLGERLRQRSRRLFIVAWMGIAFVVLAVVGHGLYHRTLPHRSLAFRWQYWTASAQMFRDHALTGVGAENFGQHYTAYKTIESPEEVHNPHNLLVQFATELGVIGLLAAIVLLVHVSWYASEAIPRDAEADGSTTSPDALRNWLTIGLVFGIVLFAVRVPLLPGSASAYVFWMTGFGGIAWLIGFGLTAMVIVRLPWDVARVGIALGCSVGALAFFVQDTINFAFFVPASRLTVLTLVAVTIALRHDDRDSEARATTPTRVVTGANGVIAVVVCIVCIWQLTWVSPTADALRTARTASSDSQRNAAYEQAVSTDPLDATAPAEWGKWLLRLAVQRPQDADALTESGLQAIESAVARNRFDFGLRSRTAQLHLVRGEATGASDEFDHAVDAAREAIRLYPQYPPLYRALGQCLRAGDDCKKVAQAIEAYEQALALDDERPEWEEFRRFTPRERTEIEERIAGARAFIESNCDQALTTTIEE